MASRLLLLTAFRRLTSISKYVFLIIYMIEFISDCWKTLKWVNLAGGDGREDVANLGLSHAQSVTLEAGPGPEASGNVVGPVKK